MDDWILLFIKNLKSFRLNKKFNFLYKGSFKIIKKIKK
jgi:hypothetical protein